MGLTIEKTTFEGWSDAYHLQMGKAHLIAVADVGPRILSLTLGGGPNLLYADPETLGGGQGEAEWHIYGGHRVWVAPESEDTVEPDNAPCDAIIDGESLTILSPVNPKTKLRKRLTISACEDRFLIEHGITNTGTMLYAGAVWGITCVVPSGVVAFPWGHGGDWDVKKIIYWHQWIESSTDVRSSQWQPGPDLFRVVPSGEVGKVGTRSDEGWIAFCRDDATFVKASQPVLGAQYPDDNCSLEVYTSPDFIELETLSPTTTFFPGLEVVHTELWTITDTVVDAEDGEALRSLIAA